MRFSMAPDNGRVNKVSRLIVNPWTGPITCCWDECDKRASSIWSIRLHEHRPEVSCSDVEQGFGLFGRHAFMTFCCEAHLLYWAGCSGWRAHETAAWNRGQIYGMAPEGSKIGRLR